VTGSRPKKKREARKTPREELERQSVYDLSGAKKVFGDVLLECLGCGAVRTLRSITIALVDQGLGDLLRDPSPLQAHQVLTGLSCMICGNPTCSYRVIAGPLYAPRREV
jgi:hypothetical protein